MLRVEYAYWLIAAFLLYADCAICWNAKAGARCSGWCWAHCSPAATRCWHKQAAGNALPAQLAGGGVILLALLAPRLRRSPHAKT
jgi:hypothetical protein